MPTYLHPGVYFEELATSQGPRSQVQRLLPADLTGAERLARHWMAEHTHAAFVGLASRGPYDEPVWLHEWRQFEPTFGGPTPVTSPAPSWGLAGSYDYAAMSPAVEGFFANGGRSCVVIRVMDDSASTLVEAFVGDTRTRSGLAGLEALDDVSLVCAPDIWTLQQQDLMTAEQANAIQLALVSHCEQHVDRLAILDAPPGLTPEQAREWRVQTSGIDSGQGTLYYPWIKVYDRFRGHFVFVPPCGHVAGVYAQTDLVRGFHHSPANQTIAGVIATERTLLGTELDQLNPVGINAIIPSVSRGILVWGNRTLSSDPAQRYIHDRRVLAFILRNIRRVTEWAIFERADDETLGPRIAADIHELLLLLWRSGALWGDTPEAAFWVRPDLHTDLASVYVDCEVTVDRDRVSAFRLVYFLG